MEHLGLAYFKDLYKRFKKAVQEIQRKARVQGESGFVTMVEVADVSPYRLHQLRLVVYSIIYRFYTSQCRIPEPSTGFSETRKQVCHRLSAGSKYW